jgi:glycosyltransferase involved in cell wall biosynthesis
MTESRSKFIVGIDASRASAARPTGVERYAFETIERLKTVVPRDVYVVLYAEATLTGALAVLPPNWRARVLPWPGRYLWAELRLGWEMLMRPPDLMWEPARSLPLVLPRRTLVTVHDLGFLDYPTAYGFVNRCYQVVSAWLAVRRAAVLAISGFTAERVRRHFGAPKHGLTVVPLAADLTAFAAAAEDGAGQAERRERLGLQRPYLLFVGRLEAKKNIDGLLAAFGRLAAAVPDVELALVGQRGRGFEAAFAALPEAARARVHELGYVAAADLPYLYAASRGLAFLSHYEGFGLPLLEAFAARVPVLCSDAAALPEVAGGAALLAPPDDVAAMAAAMRRLLEDEPLRQELVRRGSDRLAAFSWQRTADLTWQAMEGLMKGEQK